VDGDLHFDHPALIGIRPAFCASWASRVNGGSSNTVACSTVPDGARAASRVLLGLPLDVFVPTRPVVLGVKPRGVCQASTTRSSVDEATALAVGGHVPRGARPPRGENLVIQRTRERPYTLSSHPTQASRRVPTNAPTPPPGASHLLGHRETRCRHSHPAASLNTERQLPHSCDKLRIAA